MVDLLRLQGLDDLVRVGAHAGVAQQEVIDLPGELALLAGLDALRRVVVPHRRACLRPRLVHGVALPPRADQAVAVDDLRAEPRHIAALKDGVQPQRDLGQLHGDGVQVDAVHIAVGDEHLDALQLLHALVVGHALPRLLLLAGQVGLGQLGNRLVQERGAAHGGLP